MNSQASISKKKQKGFEQDYGMVGSKNYFASPGNSAQVLIRPTYSDDEEIENTVEMISEIGNSQTDQQHQRNKTSSKIKQKQTLVRHNSNIQTTRFNRTLLNHTDTSFLKNTNIEKPLKNIEMTTSTQQQQGHGQQHGQGHKNGEYSLIHSNIKERERERERDERKFRIFCGREFCFVIPGIQEYYAYRDLGNSSSGRFDVSSKAGQHNNNNNLNTSNYSSLHVRNQPKNISDLVITRVPNITQTNTNFLNASQVQPLNEKKLQQTNLRSKQSSLIGRTMQGTKYTSGNYHDEIRQQAEEQQQSEKLRKSSRKVLNIESPPTHQMKGVYIMFGFLVSCVLMLLVGHFKIFK